MRKRLLFPWVLVAGCGAVELGDERPTADAGHADATASGSLQINVAIRPVGCDGCVVLSARASGGQPPFTFEWDDGLHDAERYVCPALDPSTLRVTARDASGTLSAPHVTELTLPDASCPPPPQLLCLNNPSLEGKAAANLGFTPAFECPSWSDCADPGATNTPDVVNDTIPQYVVDVPDPTDGETFVGLFEGEQVSQELCMPLFAGSEQFLELDLRRLYVGAGVVPDNELPFLEIWSGVASDCSARELLWASPPLSDRFQTYCAALHPAQFSNLLVLRARSDQTQLSVSYLLIDNLRPVAACR